MVVVKAGKGRHNGGKGGEGLGSRGGEEERAKPAEKGYVPLVFLRELQPTETTSQH